MAVKDGYSHVEKTEYIMIENAGDLTVSVDNVMWMNDYTQRRQSFVSGTMCGIISRLTCCV